jgi:hypothetical protein
MVGFGVIFEWYRDCLIDGDDEVALWHGSEEYDFRPLSEPLVNIRYTLLKAVEDDYLTRDQAQELTEYARHVYYPNREPPNHKCPSWRNRLPRPLNELLKSSPVCGI